MDEATNCRRRSSLPEGKPAHFFKIILPIAILDKKLRVPKAFVNHHGDDFSPIITLHDPNAREWKIGLEKSEDDVWFSDGWDKFLEYYSITDEHFLVFRYEGDSRFHVLIFDMSGSEIQYPSQNPSPQRNQVASSESSKSNDHYHHWSHQNHNDNDNGDGGGGGDSDDGIDHHFTEEYYPDDEDDSTHAYEEEEEEDRYISTTSESTSPTKRPGFTKFRDRASKQERRKLYYSPPQKRRRHESSASESDGGSNSKRRRRRWKEGRRRGREEKAEWVRKQTVKSKSYKKRHISDRARAKVIQAADNYRPKFPSFRAVLRPYNLYNSFVYVPARFAVKYLGGSKKIRLENMSGKWWEARCFNRNGSGNGMSIGEGWAKFKMDNKVKEGDVCVFELMREVNIVLRVRIFRVKNYVQIGE